MAQRLAARDELDALVADLAGRGVFSQEMAADACELRRELHLSDLVDQVLAGWPKPGPAARREADAERDDDDNDEEV